MRQKVFAVMGATGHIGHVVCEELLKRGHLVRAIGRNEEKLHALELKGATAFHVDFDDIEGLTSAFQDAYAVFCMIPPAVTEPNIGAYQDSVSHAIVEALKASKAHRVVNLSSVGAQFSDGTGPIKGLHRHEERLNQIKNLTYLVHLRPGYFMENLDAMVPSIINYGTMKGLLKSDLKLPLVATRDIGWKAADFLDSTAPLGHLVFEFFGPRDETMKQAASIFGMVFDKPNLTYVQMTPDEARKELKQAGISDDMIGLLLEMYEAFNSGNIVATKDLKQTHRGTTSFEEYVHHMAHKLLVLVSSRR